MSKESIQNTVPTKITINWGNMSSNRDPEKSDFYESDDESKSDDDSNDFQKMNDRDCCPTQAAYEQFKRQWNEERSRLKAVREKLEREKGKRSVTKKIICIKKLP